MKFKKNIQQQGEMYYIRIPKVLIKTGVLDTDLLYEIEIKEVKYND